MDVQTKLADLAISDSGFVFDPVTGSMFTLNQCGRVILEGIKDGRDREQIVAELLATFEVAEGEDLQRDVDEFLQLARRQGLLPAEFRL